MIRVAIMVDGGFYRKRANKLFGEKSPEKRAEELVKYCKCHINGTLHKEKDTDEKKTNAEDCYLYRIFYYDCLPCDKNVFHPLTQKNVNLKKHEMYEWMHKFIACLKSKRKFAIRLGRLSDTGLAYTLNPDVTRSLFAGKISLNDVKESDFTLNIKQKTMDMKLGTDIASITLKNQVDRIILIAGDSDFVPAAKLARREGIDFILDPMGNSINEDLNEHIDGRRSKISFFMNNKPHIVKKD